MGLEANFENDVLVLALNQSYTVETISEVLNLAKSEEKLKDIKHVIIDCSMLNDLDNCGGEFFLLRKNLDLKSFLFCGLHERLVPAMNFFSQSWFQDDIVNFPTKKEAMKSIGKRNNF